MQRAKTDRILQILIGLCLVVLVFAIAHVFRRTVVEVGDTAPNFSIAADDGRVISRSYFGGRLLVLNFWATWCGTCIQEMPSLDQFQKTFAGSGVVVLGISVDRNEQTYRAFLRQTRVTFLTARDPEARISTEYGTFKFPETYVIDSSGQVVQKIIGATNWTDDRMVSQIKALLTS